MKWREKLDNIIAEAQAQVRYCCFATDCVCLSVCLREGLVIIVRKQQESPAVAREDVLQPIQFLLQY